MRALCDTWRWSAKQGPNLERLETCGQLERKERAGSDSYPIGVSVPEGDEVCMQNALLSADILFSQFWTTSFIV
jgi:hypothetical protein